MIKLGGLTEAWTEFTPTERRNIALYISGIMLYKFGLEAYNGSILALATNRYDYDAEMVGAKSSTFSQLGILTGLNQAFQCVGSILIAPLIKKLPTKAVLAGSIFMFGLLAAILLVVDAACGGQMVPSQYKPPNKHPEEASSFWYYGKYNTNGIIPVYALSGVVYGMVELIRRIIPRDIVGGNVLKLRKLDAMVHIFYEVSGTGAAFLTALVLIPYLGNNYAFVATPIAFTFAAIVWSMMSSLGFEKEQHDSLENKPGYVKAVFGGFYFFGISVWTGAKIIFSSRKFIWLIPGYSVALYGHRYLENGIAPIIARRYLGQSAWSQIIVGGSNFGELLGALFVFLFTNFVQTPIPWLRLDAIFLLIAWYLPFWYPHDRTVGMAWMVAGSFIPVSFGWAAGDVSITAYVQAALARHETTSKDVSPLSAVMSFLFSTYITIYAILSVILGKYVDAVWNQQHDAHQAILHVGAIHMTVVSAIVLCSTLIPRGAFTLNPTMLSDEELNSDIEKDNGSITRCNSNEVNDANKNGSRDGSTVEKAGKA